MLSELIKWIPKIASQARNPSILYKTLSPHRFPDKPSSWWQVKAKLLGLHSELKARHISYNLGSLYTVPHSIATQVYKNLVDFNPGNLGTWADKLTATYGTNRFEYEVIHHLIDLYQGDHNRLTGYISSGGTEGNIFTVWLGRQYLEQFCKNQEICLLRSSLTHYSVRKAGQVGNLPQFVLPLNQEDWSIDLLGFEEKVLSLSKQGYRGFLVPLTLGYTSTGTSDNVHALTELAERLQKRQSKLKFYFWIDAAFNGLILPFISPSFAPFANQAIQAVVVDFHKFGQVPYPAGIILYRQELKQLIEQPIDYLSETDTTLLGSRSGIPAASIWTMMHSFGRQGYRKQVEEQRAHKQFVTEKLSQVIPGVQILTRPDSLTLGIILNHQKRLPAWIEEKYDLYPGKTKLLFYPHREELKTIYKCFFLPHLKRHVIEEFIADLETIDW